MVSVRSRNIDYGIAMWNIHGLVVVDSLHDDFMKMEAIST